MRADDFMLYEKEPWLYDDEYNVGEEEEEYGVLKESKLSLLGEVVHELDGTLTMNNPKIIGTSKRSIIDTFKNNIKNYSYEKLILALLAVGTTGFLLYRIIKNELQRRKEM
jgi:hypothetical protein